MTNFMDLLSSLDFGKIGEHIQEDPQEIEKAASAVIPALLGGMQANAKDPAGAESLMGALSDHLREDEIPPLEQVDVADGEKIVRNVFGPESDNVARALSGYGFSSGLVMKLMPILAPLVMSWLSKNILGGGRARQPQAQPQQAPQQQGGGLGGILDSILGGGRQQQRQAPAPAPAPRQTESNAPAGVDISDILGDMLRGGAQQQQRQSGGGSFGLDDLLGGLGGMLGSGRR